MTRLRIPERVAAEMIRGSATQNGQIRGGLLIGFPVEDGYWIERALACRNATIDPEAAPYAVEPQILQNVTRTLNGGGSRILGQFVGWEGAESAALLGAGPLNDGHRWLVAAVSANGSGTRAWVTSPGPAEVTEVEIVPWREIPPTVCPE